MKETTIGEKIQDAIDDAVKALQKKVEQIKLANVIMAEAFDLLSEAVELIPSENLNDGQYYRRLLFKENVDKFNRRTDKALSKGV